MTWGMTAATTHTTRTLSQARFPRVPGAVWSEMSGADVVGCVCSATTTERALQFNDQSIQENFHLSMLFSAMKDDVKDINILKVSAQTRDIQDTFGSLNVTT
eukprot:1279612-Rhodomonas_salina.1